MIVCVRSALLLLLCAAACTAEFARSSHFLNTVLGSRHTAQLGLSIDDMDAMLEEARAQSSDGLQRTYIACSTLTDSAEAGEAVVAHVGKDNKQTIYSSRSRNMACWAIRATAAEARNLSKHQLMQSVVVLPNLAKIHGNVVEYFEHQVQGKVVAGKGWTRPAPKAEEAVLKIEFGLGARKGMEGIDMMEVFATWRDGSATKLRASENVKEMLRGRGGWQRVQQQTQLLKSSGAESCDFSNLKLNLLTYTLEVRGLAPLASSPQGMNCLRRLVEAAAFDHRVVRIMVTPEHRLLNDRARGITQSGTVGDEPYAALGLNGDGQVVGVADSGLDDLSCFFIDTYGEKTPRSRAINPKTNIGRRKVIQYVAFADDRDDEDGHGTHVCGSIAGKSLSGTKNEYDGMAPEAKIAFFDIGVTGEAGLQVPSLYNSIFPAAYNADAHLHSNSWGSNYQVCDERCEDIDRFTYENKDFTVLFAASNAGSNGYFSIGNPALSKNCIAVGATQVVDETEGLHQDNMAYFSSIGPTYDNRIKPDIVAPGYWIYSARSSADAVTETCEEIKFRGTSMATPVTTGNAALVRQYFEDEAFWKANCNSAYASCKVFNPSGALVKALLINSGEPMAKYVGTETTVLDTQDLPAPPDYFQGYGRVLLKNTLSIPTINNFDLYVLDNYNVAADSTIELTVTITDTTEPLRVTMSWYDPPTAGYTSKQVLHDLDLLVVAPDGTTTYWGNGVEFGDEYNNNEKVFIGTPVAGTYKVKVHAYPLVEATNQPISLVITSGGSVTGPVTGATWDYSIENRACAHNEFKLNLIDMGLSGIMTTWGMGKFLVISDKDTNEIAYLGFGSQQLIKTSACLPNGCYVADLSLAEISGSEIEEIQSEQVVVEFPQCSFLMHQGEESFEFCLNDGSCDYCKGAHKFDVKWSSVLPLSAGRSFWGIFELLPDSRVGREHFGASGLQTTTEACLDPGNYAINVPNAPDRASVTIEKCGVSLLSNQYACITVDAEGACTSTTDCEVDFDWDVEEDDDYYGGDDDDAAFGLTVSPFLTAVLVAAAAAVGLRL